MVVFAFSAARAQSDSTSLQKIEALKLKQDFDNYSSQYIDLLYKLAFELHDSNKDSMLLLIKEGLEFSHESNYIKGKGNGYLRLGNYYAMTGKTQIATGYYDKAIAIASKHKLDRVHAISLNSYGIGLNDLGDNPTSLIKFLEGIELAKKIELFELLAVLYNNVAGLYDEIEDYESALFFNEKAREIHEKNNNKDRLMRTISLIAKVQTNLKDYQSAEKALDKTIPYLKKRNKNRWLGFCYRIKGNIALDQKQYQTALEWFTKGKEIFDSYDDYYESTFVLNGLAKSYLALNEYDIAEELALESYLIAKEADLLLGLVTITQTLNEIYGQKQDFEQAWKYQKEYSQYFKKQNAKNFKNGLNMIKHEMKFENEKKELIAANNKVLAKQKNYIYLSLAFLTFLAIVLLLMYRDYKTQRKFNFALKQKQEVLIQRELELSKSNNTKDKLFSIIAHDLKGPISNFYELMKLYLKGDVTKEESQLLFPQALKDLSAVNEMLNNLLVWGKNQIQGATTKPISLDINYYINENIRLLRQTADKKSIRIKNIVSENLFCLCDKDHFDIVIRNLVSNAIKFTNSNGIITVSAITEENEIKILVKDDGVGMDLKTKNALFENNTFTSTYGTNNEKGTGLGLSLCKEMIEKNNGKIWVISAKDKGTTISFTLPHGKLIEQAV